MLASCAAHFWPSRKPYLETDFERFPGQGGLLRLYHHANSLFVVYLAEDHPLLTHPLRESLKMVYTDATLAILKVSGKKRVGAPNVAPKTVFASIELSDGTKYPLEACIKGRFGWWGGMGGAGCRW